MKHPTKATIICHCSGRAVLRLCFMILGMSALVSCSAMARKAPMGRGYSVPKRAISLDPANKNYSSYMSRTRYDYVNEQIKDVGAESGYVLNPQFFRYAYDNAQGEVEKKVVRNQIAKEMAALVDENHDIYHESLRRNMTGTNIISDFLTMGLTTSGAIASGAHATKALSALATGTKGFGATVNSHILQQQTLSALLKAITVRKERIYAEMKTNFSGPTSDYGLEDVIRDLGRYWQAGLLTGGVAELDQMSSSKVDQVNKAKATNAGASEKTEAQAVMKAASNL